MSVVYHVADLFAGAGGTSTGMLRAIEAMGGLAQIVAVNHWPVAVATHTANHGKARHYCMSLETAEPEDLVPGRRLDLLVASPECVHFSRARGGKPVNDQRRSGADWVLRWLERLDVKVLLIENVKEFMSWGDLDEKGHPVSQKRGRFFLEWLDKIRALGYKLDHTTLNAANYGDVTTRERFFLIARKDGRPIRWPEPTHRKPAKAGTGERFDPLPPWRAAREIIDWSELGPSMLDRSKPLSLKTRLRIARGLQKFGGLLAPLYIRLLDLPSEDEERFVAGCAGAVAEAFILSRNGHNDPNGRARPAADPLATVTSSGSGTGYVVSPAAEPFIAANTENAVPKSTADPFGTFTTIPGIYFATPMVEPFVFANRNNAVAVGMDQPAPTFTTATGGGAYLVNPQAEPFVLGQQSDSAARGTDQPIPTVATGGVIRLFSPFLDVYYATGQADAVDDPLSTATTKPRHALVSPLVVPYGPKAEARSADGPLPTIMTKDRLGMAAPVVVQFDQSGNGAGVKSAGEPLGVLVTKANRAVATPIASVITPGFAERKGQAPRIHDVEEPVPSIAATGHLHLATATLDAIQAAAQTIDPKRLVVIDGVLCVLDIRFRMLTNTELALAMGFPADYQFTGTKSDVTKQIGNAVPVNTAQALISAILDPEGKADAAVA